MYELLIALAIAMILLIVAASSKYTGAELLVFIFFLLVTALVGTQYFFGVNITASIQSLLQPSVDIAISPDEPEPESSKPESSKSESCPESTLQPETSVPDAITSQVFHVPGQFDFQNAKAVCKAYGAKLATVDEITAAHSKGAEWCDYGWSDDGMALFPTQTATWKAFSDVPEHKQDCGRPGVNGGYTNPHYRLGANCYGTKPSQTGPLPPPMMPPAVVDARAEYWKKQLPAVSPFNYVKWSE